MNNYAIKPNKLVLRVVHLQHNQHMIEMTKIQGKKSQHFTHPMHLCRIGSLLAKRALRISVHAKEEPIRHRRLGWVGGAGKFAIYLESFAPCILITSVQLSRLTVIIMRLRRFVHLPVHRFTHPMVHHSFLLQSTEKAYELPRSENKMRFYHMTSILIFGNVVSFTFIHSLAKCEITSVYQ